MSDAALPPILREQLARIDRDIAETGKLNEETRKFVAEAHKLQAEAAKLNRDRWLAPLIVILSLLTGLGGILAALLRH